MSVCNVAARDAFDKIVVFFFSPRTTGRFLRPFACRDKRRSGHLRKWRYISARESRTCEISENICVSLVNADFQRPSVLIFLNVLFPDDTTAAGSYAIPFDKWFLTTFAVRCSHRKTRVLRIEKRIACTERARYTLYFQLAIFQLQLLRI